MTLAFPNRSRSYDEAGQRVRFIGHDGMFEVPFFVETDALSAATATATATATAGEADYLAAFDAARATIHDVARKIYGSARRTIYVLTAADFR
ncbi:uncharacterized protein DUF1488 [Breoghania corrubedonensis]|uniref:Uncharacterized protein DUF1488 n=1 Tax=Breoghania corrubedonensis TaxID=665038 RepID=A0A2T5V6C1_9HYPH|nr:DUF1488 domain-containing protein [Breoghania corrubedonensis]PTW59299.1 uncharacterized protein DUF1488 [Breoghania corrubedonensis]